MRIVATSDTHFKFDNSLIPDGDVLLHAGDLMMRGTPDEWHERLQSLAALPHKHKFYVPGNHDYFPELYQGVAIAEMRRAGITVLGVGRHIAVEVGGFKILGLPFVTGLDGWAFNRDETWIRDYLEYTASVMDPHIIVSHSPMYGVRDAILPEIPDYYRQKHVGCHAYNEWFHRHTVRRVKHWIHGHIHESYGSEEVNGCWFHNVAMCDRNYEQNNPAVIIEV